MTGPIRNRVTELLGVEHPIVQAPMGWIARSQLASAVSNAGGLGIIETSSGELDAVKEEIRKMRDLTDKPFGVNIAQAFVRDPDIAQFVIDQGIKFVTTSAGDPTKHTEHLKSAGLTVFHVVPTLRAALNDQFSSSMGRSCGRQAWWPAGPRPGTRRKEHQGRTSMLSLGGVGGVEIAADEVDWQWDDRRRDAVRR